MYTYASKQKKTRLPAESAGKRRRGQCADQTKRVGDSQPSQSSPPCKVRKLRFSPKSFDDWAPSGVAKIDCGPIKARCLDGAWGWINPPKAYMHKVSPSMHIGVHALHKIWSLASACTERWRFIAAARARTYFPFPRGAEEASIVYVFQAVWLRLLRLHHTGTRRRITKKKKSRDSCRVRRGEWFHHVSRPTRLRRGAARHGETKKPTFWLNKQ